MKPSVVAGLCAAMLAVSLVFSPMARAQSFSDILSEVGGYLPSEASGVLNMLDSVMSGANEGYDAGEESYDAGEYESYENSRQPYDHRHRRGPGYDPTHEYDLPVDHTEVPTPEEEQAAWDEANGDNSGDSSVYDPQTPGDLPLDTDDELELTDPTGSTAFSREVNKQEQEVRKDLAKMEKEHQEKLRSMEKRFHENRRNCQGSDGCFACDPERMQWNYTRDITREKANYQDNREHRMLDLQLMHKTQDFMRNPSSDANHDKFVKVQHEIALKKQDIEVRRTYRNAVELDNDHHADKRWLGNETRCRLESCRQSKCDASTYNGIKADHNRNIAALDKYYREVIMPMAHNMHKAALESRNRMADELAEVAGNSGDSSKKTGNKGPEVIKGTKSNKTPGKNAPEVIKGNRRTSHN